MKQTDSAFTWARLACCAIVLLAYAGASKSAPIKVTDDIDPRATHCGRYENDVLIRDELVASTATGKRCEFDIAGQAPGATVVYKATAVLYDATWGRTESPRSIPLSVARPSGLTVAPTWALVQPAASTAPFRIFPAQAPATQAPR